MLAVLTSCDDDDGSARPDDSGSSESTASDEATPTTAAPTGSPVEFRPVLYSDVAPEPSCSPGDCAPPRLRTELDSLDCAAQPPPTDATPALPVVACVEPQEDDDAASAPTKYALGPARIVGGVVDADAGVPEGQVDWAVTMQLDDDAAAEFADLSAELAGTGGQIAVVLDGVVLSAPTVNGPIPDGQVQITGDFTEESARSLADRLEGDVT